MQIGSLAFIAGAAGDAGDAADADAGADAAARAAARAGADAKSFTALSKKYQPSASGRPSGIWLISSCSPCMFACCRAVSPATAGSCIGFICFRGVASAAASSTPGAAGELSATAEASPAAFPTAVVFSDSADGYVGSFASDVPPGADTGMLVVARPALPVVTCSTPSCCGGWPSALLTFVHSMS